MDDNHRRRVSERVHRARRAAEAYHRRLVGQDDLAVTGAAPGLIPSTAPHSGAPRDRRRSSILDEATQAGLSSETAELLYDLALEEGLDPALGLDLVRSGLRVVSAGGAGATPDAPIADRYLPPWMFPATPPERLELERSLRVSFRRLRSLLESEGEIAGALQRFANEPDVEHQDY